MQLLCGPAGGLAPGRLIGRPCCCASHRPLTLLRVVGVTEWPNGREILADPFPRDDALRARRRKLCPSENLVPFRRADIREVDPRRGVLRPLLLLPEVSSETTRQRRQLGVKVCQRARHRLVEAANVKLKGLSASQVHDVARVEENNSIGIVRIEYAEDCGMRVDHLTDLGSAFRDNAVRWRSQEEVAGELWRVLETLNPLVQDLGVELGPPSDPRAWFRGRTRPTLCLSVGAIDSGLSLLPNQLGDETLVDQSVLRLEQVGQLVEDRGLSLDQLGRRLGLPFGDVDRGAGPCQLQLELLQLLRCCLGLSPH